MVALANKIKSWSDFFPSDEAKVEAFDRIAKSYFEHNFGRMKKEDVDLLMFDILCNAVRDYVKAGDDAQNLYASSSPYSDYQLSHLLGITETRIRSLKEKDGLIYRPLEAEDDGWREALRECIRGSYRTSEDQCEFSIPDRGVRNALEHYLSVENGGFLEYTLNAKVVSIRSDQMFLVVCLAYGEDPYRFFDLHNRDKDIKTRLKALFQKGISKLRNCQNDNPRFDANKYNELENQLDECLKTIDGIDVSGLKKQGGHDDLLNWLKCLPQDIVQGMINLVLHGLLI